MREAPERKTGGSTTDRTEENLALGTCGELKDSVRRDCKRRRPLQIESPSLQSTSDEQFGFTLWDLLDIIFDDESVCRRSFVLSPVPRRLEIPLEKRPTPKLRVSGEKLLRRQAEL
jgi:hypothetical protein